MASNKEDKIEIQVGDIREVSGEVNIAGGDIYKGFTATEVTTLIGKISTTFQPKPFDGRSPYKGLDVFQEEDAELFFGREKWVENLMGRIKVSRTLFVTGQSGSGKSSLVRAGLIPALKTGYGSGWLYATMNPGRDPIDALANAFSRLKDPGLGKYLRENVGQASTLHDCAESALSERADQRLVLFIDQFEEVFTQLSPDKAQTFIHLLDHAATVENGRVIILFSMRSDFVSNCATYPQLNALLNQQFVQIGAMQPEELVSAIAQPALRVGLKIDPDLIAQIINDMKGEPGALPLMQFALKDLFDAEQAKGGIISLTLSDYLTRGGINEALERHANASLKKLTAGEKELARNVFSGLIEIGRGTQDTRRTALSDELIPAGAQAEAVKTVVQKLANARLITVDAATVTISHEKLIDAWPWLKKLVNENRDVIALQNEIASDAKEWEQHERDNSYLYSGARLETAREKMTAQKLSLIGVARDFIEQGITRQEAERQAKETLRRRIIIGLVAGIAIAVLLAVFGLYQAGQASNNEATAVANEQKALARQLASQAQSINATRNSKQTLADLLAMQSSKLLPISNADASSFLINNTLSAPLISRMTHDDNVTSVAFSPDGKYVVSGSWDNTVRVWEVASGEEIARMTHDDSVRSVAFSPDGKYVVSGSDDHTARVWEVASGEEIARMTHDDFVNSVAFSPDGKYVVSGSNDNTARVWEAASGREIARMTHDDIVYSVAFSPDGKYVVSGSDDGTARVWEAASSREIARMTHDDNVTSVAFSPDGKYVVSGSGGGIARVWEAASGREISRMTHDGSVYSVAFSPDGKYVVSGSNDGTARVWEAASGKEIARMTHESWVNSVAFSPDGKYVVSGSDDGTARVWEAASGREIARMTHDGPVTSVVFSPDGKYVVSGSNDGTARVWEAASGEGIARMTHDGSVNSVAFSPDGKFVVSGSADGTARVWEAASGEEIARITHDDSVNSVAFSPDGKYVVSGSDDGTVLVWEAASGEEITRMTYDDAVYSVAFSPDGKYVVSGSDDGTVLVWEAASGEEIARMTHDDSVYSVAFSPDGKYVVSGSWDNTARVWEAASGREIARMTHDDSVNSVAFSPDGKYVVSGGWDNTARVWEAASGREIARITHDDSVYSVAFSPDGKYVVSGSDDGAVLVWEAASGKEIARMTHEDAVNSVAFSLDGKYVVSGSDDGTARVWEVAGGKEIARMTHDDAVYSVAFSPDGKYVVSGSKDNTARAWAWQAEDLISNTCAVMPRNLTLAEWQQYVGVDVPYEAVCDPKTYPNAIIPEDAQKYLNAQK